MFVEKRELGGMGMLRAATLASGSAGNCAVVSDGRVHILIDAGISTRRIAQGLKGLGLELRHITGVLITHEHSDHVAALPVLAELCLPFVKVGGWFLAMKGTDCGAELEQALPTIQALGGRAAEPFDYTIPHTEVAHRVVRIEKIGPSPSQYPRRWAKIQKEGQKKAP